MFYLKTHSTHFINGCVALDQKTSEIFFKKKTVLIFQDIYLWDKTDNKGMDKTQKKAGTLLMGNSIFFFL